MEKCDNEVFEFGDVFAIVDMTKENAEEFCKNQSKETGDRYDWHYSAGRVVIKFLSKDWVNKDKIIAQLQARVEELETQLKQFREGVLISTDQEALMFYRSFTDAEIEPNDIEDAVKGIQAVFNSIGEVYVKSTPTTILKVEGVSAKSIANSCGVSEDTIKAMSETKG